MRPRPNGDRMAQGGFRFSEKISIDLIIYSIQISFFFSLHFFFVFLNPDLIFLHLPDIYSIDYQYLFSCDGNVP